MLLLEVREKHEPKMYKILSYKRGANVFNFIPESIGGVNQ